MDKSETIGNIALAMSKAQAKIRGAKENANNPFLKSKYADLGSVIDAMREPLAENELSYAQFPFTDSERIGVSTIIMHKSGEWIVDSISLPMGEEKGKSLAQVAGSVITYLRRYSLASAFGVYAGDDDDGASATQKKPQTLVSTAPKETIDERAASVKAERAEQPKQEWTEELREAYADGLGAEDKNLPQMKLQAGGVPIPSHQTSGKRVSLISPVQKTKLAELYQTLHGTNETDTIDGLNALFIAEYRRDMKDATYEQGARMTGKLLAELRHRPQEQTAAA